MNLEHSGAELPFVIVHEGGGFWMESVGWCLVIGLQGVCILLCNAWQVVFHLVWFGFVCLKNMVNEGARRI